MRIKMAPNELPSLGMLLVAEPWQNKQMSATELWWQKAYMIETLM